MKNVIMCGGNGTRLWPISSQSTPKQFCDLGFERSLFQMTLDRNSNLVDETMIVTNQMLEPLATCQIADSDVKTCKMILEPTGRNTAPVIAFACILFAPDDLVLVSAADHIIHDVAAYEQATAQAAMLAKQGYIVTYGIKPTSPNIHYGYIEADQDNVISFKEKPSLDLAQQYLDAGNYYWNSGMLVFQVSTMLREMQIYCPEILDACSAALDVTDESIIRIAYDRMIRIPSISIDYAVMEKSQRVKVVPADIGWSDVGSYDALFHSLNKDHDNNAIIGDVHIQNGKNNLIVGSEKQIMILDAEDLVVVDTPETLVIAPKGSADKIKDIFLRMRRDK